MYSSEAIFEAAQAIRSYLSELLDAELAIEIDQKLVELLMKAAKGESVENPILELLASHDSTREWLGSRLNQEEPGKLRHWDLKNYQTKNRDLEENDSSIDCYIRAEMDDHVIVQRVTTIEVIVSNDVIEFIDSATTKSKKIKVDRFKSLIVQVIPKVNFESVGESRIEIESRSLETPQRLYFDFRPTHLGEGEIWVVFRQSQLPLLTLTLTPQIVESKAQIPQRLSANGSIQNIPKLSEPLHQLRIIERRNGNQITVVRQINVDLL